jgi:hypothetical protein
MVKRIYEVKYGVKFKSVGEYIDGEARVLANGDAQLAVDKLRREVLREKGAQAFRLREVRILAEADR